MRTARNRDGELVMEIGTEEIPPGFFPHALSQLKEKAARLLSEARIPAESVDSFATPRRLVIRATGIPKRQEAVVTEITGPPCSAAYDSHGKPTTAANGFAKSQGVSVGSLKIKKTDKGDYVCAVRKQPTAPSVQILKDLLPVLITSLEFPKIMRWNGEGLKFPRPIRWIMAIFDGAIVRFRLAGLASGNQSRGHRFMGSRTFTVKNWNTYCEGLRRQHVILEPAARDRMIRQALLRLARQKKGREGLEDPELMEQAVFLTEMPTVLMGSFDKDYLNLPQEILISAMKDQQGYFPLFGKNGKLLSNFMFVTNLKTKKPAVIRAGNERVLRARLEDARFYFEKDQKQSLKEWTGQLNDLVFHQKLGSVYLKRERIGKLARFLAGEGGKGLETVRRIERAADICKSDLLTGMVREFPGLQGIMGREYALLEGQEPEVAEAIAEHYFPRRAEDQNPPRTLTGKYLTAADRLDSLVGFFGMDLMPSGSVDPYALRRQGLGLVQVLLDEVFGNLTLENAIDTAADLYRSNGVQLKKDNRVLREELTRFLSQRMETYLKRRFGGADHPAALYRPDLADVVLSRSFDNPLDLYMRYVALMGFQNSPEFDPLIVAFKRASRILPPGFKGEIRSAELTGHVEKGLYEALVHAREKIKGLYDNRLYQEVLHELARLRQPIDAFFNEVMVMDENRSVRENRLALMEGVTGLFSRFGDFTVVVVEEKARS